KDGYNRTRTDLNKTITITVSSLFISGNVFNDANYNSLKDDADGMNNVTIRLLDGGNDSVIASTTSNASGNYSFTIDNINANGYKIEVVIPTDYILANSGASYDSVVDYTTAKSSSFNLSNADVTNKHIGMAADFSVSVSPTEHDVLIGQQVYSDFTITNNGSYRIDTGKVGSNGMVSTSVTGNRFFIRPTAMGNGTYSLYYSVLHFKDGYDRFREDKNLEIKLTIRPMYIRGTVFNDSNYNSIKDDVGIMSGIKVNIHESYNNGIKDSTTTDSNGNYSFKIIHIMSSQGRYFISSDLPTGYIYADVGTGLDNIIDHMRNKSGIFSVNDTGDINDCHIGMALDVSVNVSPLAHTLKIGNSGTSNYTVTNGTFNNANNTPNPSIARKSDGTNSITYTGVATGQTSVTLQFKDGYNRSRSEFDKSISITVESLYISGNVFKDNNYNSLNDDLAHLENIEINLLDGGTDALMASTTTDSNGDYTFEINSLNASGYKIGMDMVPSGYVLANNDGDSVIDYDTNMSAMFNLTNADVEQKDVGIADDMNVSLSPLEHTVYVGDTVVSNLSLTNGSIDNLSTSNGNINASMGSNLDIMGLKAGNSVVSVAFVNGYGRNKITRNISVMVLPLPFIEGENVNIKPNEVIEVVKNYGPIDGTISCTSSKPTIASVDQNCKVTGHKIGSSVITITVVTKDGKKTAIKDIIVSVGQEKNPTINNKAQEVADSINFTLEKATYEEMHKNPQKYLKQLIQLGSAKAWSIDNTMMNKPVALVKVRFLDKVPQAYLDALGNQTNNDEINNSIYKIVYVEYQSAKGTTTVSKVLVYQKSDRCTDNMIWSNEKNDCIPSTGNNKIMLVLVLGISALGGWSLNLCYCKKD
ncbi:MAG: hypothetical protein LBT75_05875, partial [Bacilli bacterium]|nr:hypothetical protein [Bacilli bacterium]